MTQYKYEQTIWGLKFEDEHGQLHTIDEGLKCVIVVFPSSKAALIFPSIKHFENFGVGEYFYLRTFLEGRGFKCCWATHEVNLIRWGEYRIGAYQVMEKYLKGRKGRKLSLDEINHYMKVARAIRLMIGLQEKVDDVYLKVG